jgi:Rhodopirellula transposase DDE domain
VRPVSRWRHVYDGQTPGHKRRLQRAVQIKIEHRLFSFITMNWRGRPLTSYRVMVQLIANTTTTKGLKVNAALDEGFYPTGVKISNEELAAVPLTRDKFHGDWNYTIHPKPLK